MQVNIVKLLRFVHGLRSDFFEAAATLGWEEFTRDQGVSLGSYRNLFLHLAYVEEHHITQFCEGRPTPWPSFARQVSSRRYRNIDEVRRRLEEVTALAEDRLREWDTPRGLAKTVCWVRLGHPIKVTRETALTQCTTEHLLHLGEVEAMLWQHGIEPPTTLWIDREVLHGKPPAPPPVPIMKKVTRQRELLARR
jgi:uncharacterized damage-inducible protein DinB